MHLNGTIYVFISWIRVEIEKFLIRTRHETGNILFFVSHNLELR